MAHAGLVGIVVLVAGEHGVPATGETGFSGEGDAWGAPVAVHERGDVATIPGSFLVIEDGNDGGAIEGLGTRVRSFWDDETKEKNETGPKGDLSKHAMASSGEVVARIGDDRGLGKEMTTP